jgi:hypothetical protein
MREAVAQIRAAWYGAAAGSVGAGGRQSDRKVAVNCEGLVNKAIREAQQMVEGFKGLGVWGDLRCRAPEGDGAVLQFGYSGQVEADDADGWDDSVAKRLAKKQCLHIEAEQPSLAGQFAMTAGEKPVDLRQHRRSPIKVLELSCASAAPRVLRWVDCDVIAQADLETPMIGLIESTDHMSAQGIEPAVIDDAEALTAHTNDEQPVAGSV